VGLSTFCRGRPAHSVRMAYGRFLDFRRTTITKSGKKIRLGVVHQTRLAWRSWEVSSRLAYHAPMAKGMDKLIG
jgi:hypothetical protein